MSPRRDDDSPPARRRARSWPGARQSVEDRKWRAWIAYQMRAWRTAAGLQAKHVNGGVGEKHGTRIRPDVLSEIETGVRQLDVVTLLRLAAFYDKTLEDVGALFRPPGERDWAAVKQRYASDPAFSAPPTTPRLPQVPGGGSTGGGSRPRDGGG